MLHVPVVEDHFAAHTQQGAIHSNTGCQRGQAKSSHLWRRSENQSWWNTVACRWCSHMAVADEPKVRLLVDDCVVQRWGGRHCQHKSRIHQSWTPECQESWSPARWIVVAESPICLHVLGGGADSDCTLAVQALRVNFMRVQWGWASPAIFESARSRPSGGGRLGAGACNPEPQKAGRSGWERNASQRWAMAFRHLSMLSFGLRQ